MSSSLLLDVRNIHKSFGKGTGCNHVLRGLDLQVRAGEFLAIMGPSGCGKSTLLHILGLMSRPDEGEIEFDGAPLPTGGRARNRIRRADIGFVFQRFNLLAMISGRENIAISLKVRGQSRRIGEIDALLEAMGIADIAGRKPGQMSIGEQQRIAVARALAHQPKILFADEPTGSLDSQHGASLLDLLGKINREQNQTIVMITHSADAAQRAERIVTMRDGVFA